MFASLAQNICGNLSPQLQKILECCAIIFAVLVGFSLMFAFYRKDWVKAAISFLSGVCVMIVGIVWVSVVKKFGNAGAQTVNQSVNAFLVTPVVYSLTLFKTRFRKIKRHDE